jgi:hypothetical protein
MKGWIYVVDCPEDWSNTAGGYNYQILDAPHVMEQNKNPQWECTECGSVVSGRGLDPGICLHCAMEEFLLTTKDTPWIKVIVPMTNASTLRKIRL